MNKIYEKVSHKIDEFYEIKRNERSCAQSMIEYYQSWQSANKFFNKNKKFNLGKDKAVLQEYLNNYILKFKDGLSTLSDLDFISKKLQESRPDFFTLCEQEINKSCRHATNKNKNYCREKTSKLYILNLIQKSWFYNLLEEEKKDLIKKEIESI